MKAEVKEDPCRLVKCPAMNDFAKCLKLKDCPRSKEKEKECQKD